MKLYPCVLPQDNQKLSLSINRRAKTPVDFTAQYRYRRKVISTIGILGGTFDPPHRGHLNLALSALATGWLDSLWLMPTRVPPHKMQLHLTPAPIRLEMAELLTHADHRITVCDLELSRFGLSYTIDTLRHLQAQYPADSFRLIIGADMAISFDTWREAEAVLRLARPMVALRPDFPLPEGFGNTTPKNLSLEGRHILSEGLFLHEPFAASSSQIRVAIAAEDWSIADELLPPEIFDYVRDHALYQHHPHA